MRHAENPKKGRALEVLRRFGFCSLWLIAMQVLSCLLCGGALSLYMDTGLEWAPYGVGVLLPALWGAGGFCLLERFRPRSWRGSVPLLLLWTALPAALCWWADRSGPDVLWITLYPQLMARLAWFHPLFDGPQSALALDTLRPLAAAGTHVLMMAGFAAGLALGRRRKGKTKQVDLF